VIARIALVLSIIVTAFLVIDGAIVLSDAFDPANRQGVEKVMEFRARREKQCTDLGGVAIFDGLTGDLARCDFPPTRPR
jgi:hypothetical protein